MTLLQEIENLTWHNAINKLKSILKRLLTSSDANALPYKVYSALLTQSGTDAPIATVLENTLGGTVAWRREAVGVYYGTLVGAFTKDKTMCPPYSSNFNDEGTSSVFLPLSINGTPLTGSINVFFSGSNNEDIVEVHTFDLIGHEEWSTVLGDGNMPIEIKVYN